ncbi:MAG: YitT family protein [Pyramidobacter sp.]
MKLQFNGSDAKKYGWMLMYLVLGNGMIAFSICAFVVPEKFMLGGSAGISLFIQHFLPLRLSVINGVVNGLLFFLGLFFLGGEFAAASLFSTLFYPLLLGILETMPLESLFLHDRLMAALFTGVLQGAGVGLIIRAGASSGGMDIPPCILQKYRGIPVGNSMFLFDVVIIGAQVFLNGPQELLYSLLISATVGMTLNRTVIWGDGKVQVMIISQRYRQICEMVLHDADVGATLLHIDTAFRGLEQRAVLTVMHAKKYPVVKGKALAIDPNAFIITSSVTGVNGQGYTLTRQRLREEDRIAPRA